MRTPFVSRIVLKVAPKAGATVRLEPQYGFVGQITFRDGRKRYFRNQHFDLNPLGASEISADKDYASFFLRTLGYPVIEGEAFYSAKRAAAIGSTRNPDAAYDFARKLGFPVIVKPNSKSQGVEVNKVWNKRELYRAARRVFRSDNVMLVQCVVTGHDYRIVVLDREIISAYERLPLTVVGDGRTPILGLLRRLQRRFVREGRDTVIRCDDGRMALKLARSGISLKSIPKKGVRVQLLDNANLSSGGDAIDMTRVMHPSFKRLAIRITKDMGLRLCGVDLMVEGDIRKPVGEYRVIEINAAPGLDNYASTGKRQAATVERLYLKVLRALQRQR